MPTKVRQVRESRDAIPRQGKMYLVKVDDATILANGTDVSVLRGPLADWVSAHMIDVGEATAEVTPADGGGYNVTGDDFTIAVAPWPKPAAPEPAALEPAPVVPPAPILPLPDMPRPPTTEEDWRLAISNSQEKTLPILAPAEVNETVAAYSARVLSGEGLTLAEVARDKVKLAAIAVNARDPSWAPVLAAAGVSPSTESRPDHTQAA